MSTANLFILIVPRVMTDGYSLYLKASGLRTVFSFPCAGTASPRILSRLGLEKNEKTLILSMMNGPDAQKLMDGCVSDMGLNMPGSGIAMRVPVQAVGGKTALSLLTENKPVHPEKDHSMEKQAFSCSLIVVICEGGHSDDVMKAARSAGAGGGTVVHAKGTAGDLTRKFLGISLAEEKDLILILTVREDRDGIMRAVMDQAGLQSEAHAVLFALPVESVAGMRSLMDRLQAEPGAPEESKKTAEESPAGEGAL